MLVALLCSRLLPPPSQNILSAHDMVAQKDYVPRLPELPADGDDEEEETVKIVQLVKSNEPLVSAAGAGCCVAESRCVQGCVLGPLGFGTKLSGILLRLPKVA